MDTRPASAAPPGRAPRPRPGTRSPLTRDAVLAAAVALADAEGLGALTMRRLAGELGFEVMSLYHHVANKDEVLDGMVELVAAEVELPPPGAPWRDALRGLALGTRDVLVRHPWAAPIWSARAFGVQRMRLVEAQLAALADSGIDPELAHQGFHALQNHVLGFALQEQAFVFEGDQRAAGEHYVATLSPTEFPHLIEHIREHLAGTASTDEFAFVLDLILDRLAALA